MGVRAVLSSDGGETWDTDNIIVLRDDGGTPNEMRPDMSRAGADLGYPISTQLAVGPGDVVDGQDGPDGITHAASCRWEV